ncbi:decapping nuclease Rai1p [[Candida] railenensis]|uniref:Decapping nuclease n=1 Tax=[Candida] railenensis TaxID=45579 RepID=A0A9P0W003_9ASCO|nr:decapping nuclease Rai1p [[Candida] railenensis]
MMKTFPLNSRAQTTALKQPKELFSYARDIDGAFIYDESKVKEENLSYYYLPDSSIDKQIDLGGGFQNFKKIPEAENLGDFPGLLKAIINYEKRENCRVNADIITFRGLMTKILALPYNLKDPIDFNIVTYDGQIFIKNDEEIELRRRTEQKQSNNNSNSNNNNGSDYQERCEFSGYKFETISTLPRPWADCSRQLIEKRNKKIVNNYEQYISVVRTGIGKVKVLLAGEVDCIWDFIPENGGDVLPHYVELKTSRILEHPGQIVNFEKKLFKTWAQCFLLGIRKVVYGFRDDNLILRSVEVYKTEEIPLLIKNNPLTEANKEKIVAMNAVKWYGAVLEWLTKEVSPTSNNGAWRLSFDPGSRSFNLSELTDAKKVRDEIISEEFKEWRSELKSKLEK